jgi:hypothetical protein
MNKFLKNIITYIVSFYSILFLAIYVTNYVIKKRANFKLEPNITKIILGNSQPECAYNDTIISNFKNLAKSGESYFYNYHKLKQVLNQNKQLNTVYIEFSTPNILVREDEKIWENRFINHHLPNYFNFLDFRDHKLLATKNITGYTHSLFKSLKLSTSRIILNKYNYIDSIGGYKYLVRDKTKRILDTLKNKPFVQKHLNNNDISNWDLKYLKKMIELCKHKNISVYLVRSPYHKQFTGNTYESSFQEVRQKKFSTVPFLDFKNFPVQNSEFGDLQHLNYKGATKFSIWFNIQLQENSKEE